MSSSLNIFCLDTYLDLFSLMALVHRTNKTHKPVLESHMSSFGVADCILFFIAH